MRTVLAELAARHAVCGGDVPAAWRSAWAPGGDTGVESHTRAGASHDARAKRAAAVGHWVRLPPGREVRQVPYGRARRRRRCAGPALIFFIMYYVVGFGPFRRFPQFTFIVCTMFKYVVESGRRTVSECRRVRLQRPAGMPPPRSGATCTHRS